jgi:short-subunit dehydrogenase
MRNKPDTRTVLITGASSGIGAAFACFLAIHGLHVFIAARRENRLKDLAEEIRSSGGEVDFFPCDLEKSKTREELVHSVLSRAGHLDILINDAGFGWYGYFYQMDWADAARMLAVNMEAVAHLSRLVLPDMTARHKGHIINISSIAGSLPNQGIAMYSASKAFVDAFTTALYRELYGSGVWASAMRLGPIQTEFFEQARQLKNGSDVPAERFAIPVERVNRALWNLLRHPRRVIYVPAWQRMSTVVEPLFGGIIDHLGPLLLRRDARRNSK